MACSLDKNIPLPPGENLRWLEERGGTWDVWGVQCGWPEVHSHVRAELPTGEVGLGSDVGHAVANLRAAARAI